MVPRTRSGLRIRVFLTLVTLILVTLTFGSIMVWYAYGMETLFTNLITVDVRALEVAEELETALANQQAAVFYYLLVNDADWLDQVERHRRDFRDRLEEAQKLPNAEAEKRALAELETAYSEYIHFEDQVGARYAPGNQQFKGALQQSERYFAKILGLSDRFRELWKKRADQSWRDYQARTRQQKIITGMTKFAAAVTVILAFVLVIQILEPIQRLARETAPAQIGESDSDLVKPGDDIDELSQHVSRMVEDADHTRAELERSRELLWQSEKMATIGALAADLAHSIRNPMTSIKMRLFSLERSLDLSPTQQEDLGVVSEEMRRLDNIVCNFLEFSRPHRLHMQKISVSEILDVTLRLFQHQLELAHVQVERERRSPLPSINGDPELLKEVLVNLIVNACECMEEGGKITISEEEIVDEEIGGAVLIRISDTGPGISEHIQERVFQPFFSTKEDGTGLGLAVAARIIAGHGGRLTLRSKKGEETTFSIALPITEEKP